MKTQVTSFVLTSAIALFAASANANSIHSVLDIQPNKVTHSQNNTNVVDPKTSIHDYVNAAREEKAKERKSENVRAQTEAKRTL